MNDRSETFWPLLFCGYFAFQALYRWLLGGNLGLDEAQIFLDAQRLAWGYGPQPPLYAWLQWGMFRLVGDPLLAMALLKNALLATTYLAVYALMRGVRKPQVAGLAAASLMLLPQIAWESQRALTHSVLATTLAALTVLVFGRQVLGGRPWAYPLFGLVVGLGLIAKANFAVVPVSLLVAAASRREWRARLRPAWLALSAGVAAALAAGPVLWMVRHADQALASTYKLRQAEADEPAVAVALRGLAAVAGATLGFLVVLAVVAAVIRWRFGRPAADAREPIEDFLVRVVVVGFVAVILVVVLSGTTSVKDRWLQQVLFLTAPLVTLWLGRRVIEPGMRWLRRTIFCAAALVTLALPVHLLTGTPGEPARGGAPVAEVAAELVARFPETERILGDPEWLAGNLLYKGSWPVVDRAREAGPGGAGPALIVWMVGPDKGAALAALLAQRTGETVRLDQTQRLAAPYRWQPSATFEVFAAPVAPSP